MNNYQVETKSRCCMIPDEYEHKYIYVENKLKRLRPHGAYYDVPDKYVNKTIAIRWKTKGGSNNIWYVGKVLSYKGELHKVLYNDGHMCYYKNLAHISSCIKYVIFDEIPHANDIYFFSNN
jgi:hypothetical protein